MKKIYQLVAIIVSVSFLSCEDKKAIIPGYLKIDDVILASTLGQGSSTDRITDINVFINDQSLGIFELPALVPIQTTGKVNLKIRGVIYKNGKSNEKVDYPFYKTYQVDTNFVPEMRMELTPTITYETTAVFDDPWSGEDFEAGVNFNYNPRSDTVFERVSDNQAFEGTSGLAYLTEDMTLFEAWSSTFADIPRNGKAVWLEMDYKSTHQFGVSIFYNETSTQTQEAITIFNPRATYGKVYIELGTVFSTLSGAFNYTLAIGFPKAKGETAQFYIDNVKLIRFE
jgi:hypothetical protein